MIAVIGPQTAKTAAEFGLRVDVMAPKPSVTALVEAVAEYGAGLRDAAVEAGEPVRRRASAAAAPRGCAEAPLRQADRHGTVRP